MNYLCLPINKNNRNLKRDKNNISHREHCSLLLGNVFCSTAAVTLWPGTQRHSGSDARSHLQSGSGARGGTLLARLLHAGAEAAAVLRPVPELLPGEVSSHMIS